MAETASLLASAAYEQPQAQLHHYKAKLTEHLADPTRPLNLADPTQLPNLALEPQNAEGQARRREPSGERAGVQLSGVIDSPPRTPGQDAAGRAARAKRVANSREVRSTACAALPDPCHPCKHTRINVSNGSSDIGIKSLTADGGPGSCRASSGLVFPHQSVVSICNCLCGVRRSYCIPSRWTCESRSGVSYH